MTLLGKLATHVVENRPAWRTSDDETIPVVAGEIMLAIGIKGIELAFVAL